MLTVMLNELVVEITTEDTVDDDPVYPSLYTSSRFPAPQNSELFPLQVILQSERPPGARVGAFSKAFPQSVQLVAYTYQGFWDLQHSPAYSAPANE